ncbi:MAG TPA: hypothetical protein DCS93_19450 [Microscillaceae bacterium]|nr:hypothetical protein [Microscillaceae bacterium]
MPQIQLNLSLEQVNIILKALDHMPYGEVNQLVSQIHQQAEPQLQESSTQKQSPEKIKQVFAEAI